MPRKNTLVLLAILLFFILACSIPSTGTNNSGAAERTAIAKTVDAASGNGAETPRPQGSGQLAGGDQGQSQRPTPTKIPTKPAPTTSANAAPQSETLSVGNVNFYPPNTVYYGNCGNGEETYIHVEATVAPLNQIKEVLLWADISDSTGIVYSDYVKMWQLGIGDYAGDIDIGQIAPGVMIDADGSVTFWLEVVDNNNASMHSNAYGLSVWECGAGGVLAPPPAGDVSILSFTAPASATAGDIIYFDWNVSNACKVFFLGNEVSQHSGTYEYTIPDSWGGQNYSFNLNAFGSSCDSSSEVVAYVDIQISEIPSTISKGSGNVYDDFSLDLGDGNDDDMIFDHQSGDVVLLSVWGSELLNFGGSEPHTITQCASLINAGSSTQVSISPDDYICYKTGSGNYGYLEISGMYLDLDNRSNSYIDISYSTEIMP